MERRQPTPQERQQMIKAQKILESEKNLKLRQNLPGLRPVMAHYFGLKERPIDIVDSTPEGVVFFNLQVCYQNQGNVSEGTVEDVIWGFRQSGIPNNVTWDGFRILKKLGYLRFTNDIGVALIGNPTPKMWYQWTPKYFEILLDRAMEKDTLEFDKKIKGEDTTVDKVK